MVTDSLGLDPGCSVPIAIGMDSKSFFRGRLSVLQDKEKKRKLIDTGFGISLGIGRLKVFLGYRTID
jgi:hypothetical protein